MTTRHSSRGAATEIRFPRNPPPSPGTPGEGWGEGLSETERLHAVSAGPLTLALSPEYWGEGTRAGPTRSHVGHPKIIALLALLIALLASPAAAYVEVPYALGRLVQESTNVVLI